MGFYIALSKVSNRSGRYFYMVSPANYRCDLFFITIAPSSKKVSFHKDQDCLNSLVLEDFFCADQRIRIPELPSRFIKKVAERIYQICMKSNFPEFLSIEMPLYFTISSYLKKPGVIIRDLKYPRLKEHFISTDNLIELVKYQGKFNRDYIDGYIFIAYQGQILLDAVQWDLIDQLWAYILHMIEEVLDHKYAQTYFPDQPLLMSFKDQKRHLVFELYGGERKWILPKKEFFNELLDAAEIFFNQVHIACPLNYYDVELAQIKRLRRRL